MSDTESKLEIEVEISVDKEQIKAKGFVQNVIGKAMVGAVSTLKGVNEDWTEIELKVKRK